MRYRLLPLAVLLAVAAHLALASAPLSPQAAAWLHLGFRVAGRTAAAAACLAAALCFERGDYLRRGWAFLAGSFLLLLAKDAWRGPLLYGLVPPAELPAPSMDVVRDGLVIAANVLGVASSWVLFRTWYRAGLDLDASWRRQALAYAVAAALALLAVGSTLVSDVTTLAAGGVNALARVVSDVSDLLCFVLMAPLVLLALAVRGGLLAWTWGHLAAGSLAWLLMDVLESTGAFGAGAGPGRLGEEAARTLAAACFAGAGLAQRWILSERRVPEAVGPAVASLPPR